MIVFKSVWIGVVLALSAQADAQNLSPLLAEDVFALEAASDPQISADGQSIVYVRNTNDILSDQTRRNIWIIDTNGENHLPISTTTGNATNPRWSPSGDRIAYVTDESGFAVIHVYWMSDGRDAEIARVTNGVSGLSWSPDGTRLAYAGFVPTPPLLPAPLLDRPANENWAAPAIIEDRLVFKMDGVGALPNGSLQLFLVDADGGPPTRLSYGPDGASADFSWTPDSRAILFAADRRADRATAAPDNEIHRIEIDGGRVQQLTARIGPDTNPQLSPDGEYLAYLGYDDLRMGYHNTLLYLANPDGSEARALTTELDRSVTAFQWNGASRSLYVQYDDRGATRIAQIFLDGRSDPIASGLGGASLGRPYTGGEFSVSAGGIVAATTSTATRPSEIVTFSRRTSPVTLTQLNEDVLANRSLSLAEAISWTSPHDAREISGWLLYPPNFDPAGTYPLILEIHGGPFTAYGPVFSAELQLMAAAGYVVLYANPRGSTSYGYEFANLIHHDYPGNDYDDLMGGVDAVLARGFIDPQRLFVTGGSGGGVLAAWITGNTDRFAAAAVVKPVINWSSFVLNSDLPQFFYRYWFASAPWEDPEEYWRRSPLSLVGNVSTPTLMMVGGADVRTPRSETEQYYSALRLRGVPSRLVIIPESFHGIANSRPSRLLTKVAEILRWFETYDVAGDEDLK
jgi:dipeptidyl aminopeptidase/acylaminoacyl peptidase